MVRRLAFVCGWRAVLKYAHFQEGFENPFGGALFAFRGKRGGLVKLLWYDGQGLCLFSKRLERGHFVWPVTETWRVSLTPAQLSMLLEGIDWRMPKRVPHPELAG